ncbi:PP2C family serine/threonine-protein phosphatase [Aliinostoc sp. HNIBRCY26]|uniref:PP2C family serine/threonine-protein phosphatase n=1 Tax=Aliinostoc sp. HNIBRCY26 TaxID=3418997 RepID=UPI003CFD2178
MENDAATLHCPICQADNPLTNKFCQQCSTPLPQRYLWVVGDVSGVGSPGDLLADRYLIINPSVVLDTHPGLPPQVPDLENIQAIRPYLRLIPYRLNIPQIYGVVHLPPGYSPSELLLLEKPPLVVDGAEPNISLCSKFTDAWQNATSMRQLNWLWQIAQLWQPLKSEGVVSSLLDTHLLRVEGSLIKLLELRFDPTQPPELVQLGEFWQQLGKTAKPAIAEFVEQISNLLIAGEINTPELLIAVLDQGLRDLGQTQNSSIHIITKTDTGPRRERNEDACYPSSGTIVNKPPHTALAIVCDGIGGHEGGNVASNLAIDTIQQQVQELTRLPADHVDPAIVLADLEKAVAIANDKISQRNDSEHRQGRKRMGTTLVMALPLGHEMYITHVGDSRAYWITPQGCYQVTLDDDVASREVRLGYAIYREAVQQSGAGSLVQALGMSPSSSLHPTAQRFICDEDTVFLLTSDGLSDFDRVEEYWEKEILPILNGGKNLTDVANRLIELANTKNGHDNVTIALVHYQVKYTEPSVKIQAVIPDSTAIPTAAAVVRPAPATPPATNLGQPTKVLRKKAPTKISNLPLTIIVPLLLGFLTFWITSSMRDRLFSNPSNPIPATNLPATTEQPETPQRRSLDNLAPGWVIKINKTIPLEKDTSLQPNVYLKVDNRQNDSVSLRRCPVKTLPPEVAKLFAAPIKLEYSKLQGLEKQGTIEVLQANSDNPCEFPISDDLPPAPNTPGNLNQ